MSNPNYDQILSTTLDNYRDKFEDNFFNELVLLWILKDSESVRKISGGRKIVEQLMYDDGQASSYGEYEQVTITPQDGLSAAEYPWRQALATVAISGLQELQNNGEEEIIDLLKAKVFQAEMTLKSSLNTQLFADGTGNSGKNFLGLEALIGTADIGGIDSDTYTYWRSYTKDMSGIDEEADGNLRKWLTTAYNTAGKGSSDNVKYLIGDQATFEKYEASLVPQQQYEDVKTANAGFTNLKFKQVPFVFDVACTANTVYGINPKYLRLVGHKNRWFKNSPFTENPINSAHASSGAAAFVDARYSVITLAGNLTCSNRSKQFKLYDIGTV